MSVNNKNYDNSKKFYDSNGNYNLLSMQTVILPLLIIENEFEMLDKENIKQLIFGNELWLKYITDFLIYLDTDKNKTIQANAIYSIESSNKNKNTFTETTCDDYKKDENTSFWVDVQSGNTKNTILDYMKFKIFYY